MSELRVPRNVLHRTRGMHASTNVVHHLMMYNVRLQTVSHCKLQQVGGEPQGAWRGRGTCSGSSLAP